MLWGSGSVVKSIGYLRNPLYILRLEQLINIVSCRIKCDFNLGTCTWLVCYMNLSYNLRITCDSVFLQFIKKPESSYDNHKGKIFTFKWFFIVIWRSTGSRGTEVRLVPGCGYINQVITLYQVLENWFFFICDFDWNV